jgi:hypothetical protein
LGTIPFNKIQESINTQQFHHKHRLLQILATPSTHI